MPISCASPRLKPASGAQSQQRVEQRERLFDSSAGEVEEYRGNWQVLPLERLRWKQQVLSLAASFSHE